MLLHRRRLAIIVLQSASTRKNNRFVETQLWFLDLKYLFYFEVGEEGRDLSFLFSYFVMQYWVVKVSILCQDNAFCGFSSDILVLKLC